MWPGSDSEDEFRLFPGANSDEEEEMEREESERMRSDWTKLIIWLSDIDPEAVHKFVDMKETIAEGRGLFLTKAVAPNTRLIQLPAQSLLNKSTLARYYPAVFPKQLSSTIFISMHIALQLQRDTGYRGDAVNMSIDDVDFFQPFIATLPKAFNTVPLTWSTHSLQVKSSDRWERARAERAVSLLQSMPPSVKRYAGAVKLRFDQDWKTIEAFWEQHRESVDSNYGELRFPHFVIAWLNVNSRCVFYPLEGGTTEDNLTLAPVFDMMNHVPNHQTTPIISGGCLLFSTPKSSSTDAQPRSDDELMFTYGPHEDAFLIAEYGFTQSTSRVSNPYNCIDISEPIIKLFARLGKDGERKQALLENEGYWGDSTVSSNDFTASFRTLIQLRLYCHDLGEGDSKLQPWLQVVRGEEEVVTRENEKKVEKVLRSIASKLIKLYSDFNVPGPKDNYDVFEHDLCSDMLMEIWEFELDALKRIVKRYK